MTADKCWSPTTKRTIIIGFVILFFFFVNRVSAILAPILITLILAYILVPVVDFLSLHLRLNRTLVTVIIHVALLALIFLVPVFLIPPLISQIESFVDDLPYIVRQMGEFIKRPVVFGDLTVELQDVYGQVSNTIEGMISSLANQSISILSNIATALLWVFFILMASFYLVKDYKIIFQWLDEVVPPGYHDDFHQLRFRIAASWNAFLRGQLLLCLTMGILVGIIMAVIGLPNAWLIGLMFGFLEFIPNLGPTIATVPTVFIAFFQGSTVLDVSNAWFAVLVVAVNFGLQQLENSFLVPRIMGQSLNLHPLVILIAVMSGARIAGVLGVLIAAPTVATLRVLAEYTYYRLLDKPPFPIAEKETEAQEEQTPPESEGAAG